MSLLRVNEAQRSEESLEGSLARARIQGFFAPSSLKMTWFA
jgi:hypothetical protein